MKFFADLHIHSRFSRATSKSLNLHVLAQGAREKGITVLGTGDFTHPAWLGEIEAELEEAEPGLFRLKRGGEEARFMLTAEISTIYKQGDKVRKVHHLIAAPDLASARRISTSLARVGNILSDGRPILGITSRNLLEIVLQASEHAFLIPAHIWTPWFSALGSKSGFDTIEECYGDLAPHIFAVETGLSSDPPMNWTVRSLDGYHLISNSDAHSAEKLGREATIFETALDYFAMLRALKEGEGLAGTVEFFPEEGKYHLDGHRDCGVVLSPGETSALGGVCPVCGKKVTVGVLNRVEELADRHDGSRPVTARPFFSLVPLAEILGEILQTGSASKRVREAYAGLIARLGGELPLLLDRDIEEVRSVAGDVLALALTRMRTGEVCKEAGYDGRFGRVRVFRDHEDDLLFSGELFGKPLARAGRRVKVFPVREHEAAAPELRLSPAQQDVAACSEGRLVVRAGPGTGKTRTLVERIRSLLAAGRSSILAVTFTVKAAQEIRDRLEDADVDVLTFHALAARILREGGLDFQIADEDMLSGTASRWGMEGGGLFARDLLLRLSTARPLENEQAFLIEALQSEGYYTYEGMISEAIRLISSGRFAPAWDHIMVDEFQDINPLQYEFLKLLCPRVKSLMVIGDPSQSIYAFRGSSPASFDDFLRDHPDARCVDLTQTYRLHSLIADGSNAFIGRAAVVSSRTGAPIRVVRTHAGAEFIAREIEYLAGGLSSRSVGRAQADYSLSDIAVIVRTRQQAQPVLEALSQASIPFDTAYARPLASLNGVSQRLALLELREWQALVKGVGRHGAEKAALAMPADSAAARKLARADALLSALDGQVPERVRCLEESSLFKLPDLGEGHVFYQYARMFGDDVDGFIRFLRLSNDQSALAQEKVRVITAHAAKGLEFKCVFIPGLSQGAFPLEGCPEDEERNLFYVAMTRAVDLLYLVSANGSPSPFVSRIPLQCCAVREEAKKSRTQQLLLFEG
jgi:uncharacterized protein (TIGR00375 family)